MTRRIVFLLIVAFGVFFISTVSSGAATAGDEVLPFRGLTAEALFRECKSVEKIDLDKKTAPADDIERAASCLSYVSGAIDQQVMSNIEMKAGRPNLACRNFRVPLSVSGYQLAKIIVKFGDDHPEVLNEDAISFVDAALVKAFPCR